MNDDEKYDAARTFDAADYLLSEDAIVAFLAEAAIDDDPALMIVAEAAAARARARLAKAAS